MMPSDRRTTLRRDVFRTGEIWIDSRSEPINCIVRNASIAGALIEVLTTDEIPAHFWLWVSQINLNKSCLVVRRTQHLFGVAFL
jgi:hypothetical protein